MAEIRSTLDIIMEKTKNMTMNDEEKAEFKRQVLTGKIRGWFQKYLDGIISMKELISEITSERNKSSSVMDELIKKELVGRIDPNAENDKIFQLLEEILNMDIDPFVQTIGNYREDMIKEKAVKIEVLLQKLAEKQIAGSAIVPNVDQDASWKAYYEASTEECKKQLSIIADRETIDSR